MHGFGGEWAWGLGIPGWAPPFFALLLLWSVVWKGLALWHSARRAEKWWFVAFLLLNTAGILEIVYLFGFCKLKFSELFTKGHHHA